AAPETLRLGDPLPKGDPHAVSVHLPRWEDNVGWAERDPAVLGAMTTGYPRFFIPRAVTKLGERFLAGVRHETQAEFSAYPFASASHALLFALHIWGKEPTTSAPDNTIRLYLFQCLQGATLVSLFRVTEVVDDLLSSGEEHLFFVTFPSQWITEARKFVQHTGYGISSRRAMLWDSTCCFTEVFNKMPQTQDGFLQDPKHAEDTLRWRIAACVCGECNSSATENPEILAVDPSKDVYLYPTGMAAIGGAIRIVTEDIEKPRVAVVGFLYLDTIKLLQMILGEEQVTIFSFDDIDTLEKQLQLGVRYEAVFTEFPGNPLLQCPDLSRLRNLSLTFNFYLVVDDTIGTSAALNLLDECDIICTSLTKMFSGGCNVMGGSTMTNPNNTKERLNLLRTRFESSLLDMEAYFDEDIIVMERNSRDFVDRVLKASQNAEAMLELFKASPAVKNVSYPKGSKTQDIYDRYKKDGAGYGFLMSIEFYTDKQAMAFYDNFDVAKGPSLGTNFTLCCPYSILAHYREQEWAASHGVVPHLVRISFGLEDNTWLEERVLNALSVAE
ncbi:putative cystathionine gamma-synthase/beta-lyase, partial [Podospora fimiseda]